MNSTVRDAIHVADGYLLAASAMATADTIENGDCMGVPARHHATPAGDLAT